MTAYNLRNKMYRSGLAGRQQRLDPGSAGTIIVTPVDRAAVICTGAGTRTLESAAGLGVGTSILCLSQTAAVVIAGATSETIGDGEFVKFEVVQDSSGDNEWQVTASTALNTAVADIVTAEGDVDALEALRYRTFTEKLNPSDFRVHDDLETKLTVQPSATDDLGVDLGVIGAATVHVLSVVNDAAGALTQEGVYMWRVPQDYVAAEAITLSVDWVRVDAASVSCTLDSSCYRAAAPSTDIAGAAAPATDVNGAASGTITWALTTTNVVPGEWIYINLICASNDGAATSDFTFDPEIQYTVTDQS